MYARRLLSMIAAICLLAAATATAAPVAGGGGPYTHPGCAPTLQQCIDNAESGATIHIATETVAESVSIVRSLTLDAAPGFTPTIDGVGVGTTEPTTDVTIDGLGVVLNITAVFSSGTGHSLTIRDARIDGANLSGSAVDFFTQVPADLTVEGSSISSSTRRPTYSIFFGAELTSGIATLSVIGNRITHASNDNGATGVRVVATEAGQVRADIMNNAIFRVARCDCFAGVIHAFFNDVVQADVNVVGNTLEGSSGYGIVLRNTVDAGGSVALDVFDNIISHHPIAGIHLENELPTTLDFRASYNDFHVTGPNRLEGESLGRGTLHVDPQFVNGSSDLRLRSTSPLIDAGQVCTPGGVANPDAAGNHRLAGESVDMGAYERGAVSPTGEVRIGTDLVDLLLGTDGADILCGYRSGDHVAGLGGNDYMDGGRGNDQIVAGSGSDRAFGRRGSDFFCARDGVNGNDQLDGGKGSDGYDADPGDVRTSMEYQDTCPN